MPPRYAESPANSRSTAPRRLHNSCGEHESVAARPGKIEVVPTKEAKTQRDLSLAYSPGVAEPCKEIYKNPDEVYKYTAKGNLVAVMCEDGLCCSFSANNTCNEGKGISPDDGQKLALNIAVYALTH